MTQISLRAPFALSSRDLASPPVQSSERARASISPPALKAIAQTASPLAGAAASCCTRLRCRTSHSTASPSEPAVARSSGFFGWKLTAFTAKTRCVPATSHECRWHLNWKSSPHLALAG
eukprot:5118354-Pleurochrysis_carterae.AAC.2